MGPTRCRWGGAFMFQSSTSLVPTPEYFAYIGEPTMPWTYMQAEGGLGQLYFYDANHNNITSSVQYSFVNGTEFYAGVTPEPSSFVSLGTGLVVLAAYRRRRGSVSSHV